MERIKLRALSIETTRKCNKKCFHCMKGKAQDISISKEIIDKIFTDIADCKHFYFSGGESLLEIETLEYIIDKSLESNWNLETIQLTTNGTILDERICDLYKKFCKGKNNRFAHLRISNDPFHDLNTSRKAYNYYKSIIEKANKELGREALSLVYVLEDGEKQLPHILYSGNAKDYVDLNKNKFTPNGNIPVKCCDQYNHRAKIVNNEVYCRLHISANGNIGFDEERSYELADKLTFGNILDDDITSLILKHNDNCLLRCEETTDLTTFCDTWRFVPNVNSDSRIYFQIVGLILEKFILARTIAKEKFEYVTAQDLIENIPFPQVGNKMPNLVERIYNRYSKQFLNPYSYTNALLYVLNLL